MCRSAQKRHLWKPSLQLQLGGAVSVSITVLLGIECDFQICTEVILPNPPTPLGWGGGSISYKISFTRNCIKCPDLHRNVMFTYLPSYGGRGREKLPKQCARKCMKCPDLYRNVMFATSTQEGLGPTSQKCFFLLGIE